MTDGDPSPLELGQAAAAQLGGTDWELDAEIVEAIPEEEPEPILEFPRLVPAKPVHPPEQGESPPALEQIIEAMLFLGGHPLTSDVASRAVRGLKTERFEQAIDNLNRRYRRQGRPYSVQP